MIIMATYKIIYFTIIASVLLFQVVRATGDHFTAEKYLGVWYTVGATINISPLDHVSCDRADVTRRNNSEWTFNEIGRAVIKGKFFKYQAYGKVVNSEIHIIFPHEGNREEIFTFTSYNNGEELILHDKNDEKYNILSSRKTTASIGAKRALEKHAMDAGYYTAYFRHNDCSLLND